MLALITQTKVQRPWIQLGTGTVIHIPLKSIEESQTSIQLKPAVEGRKRKSSKIPRMIRTRYREQTEEEHKLSDSQAAVTQTCHNQAAPVAASPVVRSTRTSRCRIKLAHPEWPPVNRSPSPSPVSRKREISEPQRVAVSHGKRKCLIEPLLQLSPSVIEVSDPLKNFGGRKQLLRLLCCDHKLINVPCQLINRYSSLMCERQKDPNFYPSRPIQLDSVSSTTLLRLVQWMQQHCHDDLGQLQKMSPSLENAKSSMCTWDERFFGFDLEKVLQLLLAANFLGINPLMEHTMIYFVELIEQRNNVKRVPLQHESQTQTDLQQWYSSGIHNAEAQVSSQMPQFVATAHLC
ncbi:uncharacterized protein LOC117794126 [Drosophila innubila]|uniref:uncharacterized protein LOC117794126 n=1 Tax=Drosophila innubila TaxID=198719 RepID=UPI00148DC91A|nr:uncharacterized protein LOC117794126 [Drosophila innubila]